MASVAVATSAAAKAGTRLPPGARSWLSLRAGFLSLTLTSFSTGTGTGGGGCLLQGQRLRTWLYGGVQK